MTRVSTAGRSPWAARARGATLGELSAGWFNPDGSRSDAETLASGSTKGVAIGGTAAGNAAEHNYLNHLDRVTLNKADKACKTSGQQCDTAAALKYKDELSDRLLANAVAACEGEACNDTVDFINQRATDFDEKPFWYEDYFGGPENPGGDGVV